MAISPQASEVRCSEEKIHACSPVWKVRNENDSPCGRYGHTLTLVNNRIYMFGGYSDVYHGELYVYNDNGKWIPLNCGATSPRPRFGHIAFAHDGYLYIFGGDSGYKSLNDVWKYDLFNRTWSLLEIHGQIPEARASMGCAVVKDKLFIFGGVDRYFPSEKKFYDDIYQLDLKTNTWTVAKVCQKHCCCKKGEAVSEDTSSSRSTDHEYMGNKNSNNAASPLGTVAQKEVVEDISKLTKGDLFVEHKVESLPCARKGLAMFSIGDKIYVFSGVDSCGNFLNDFWSFNTKTFAWSEIKMSNGQSNSDDLPLPRAYAGICQYNNQAFMFGGVSEKDYLNDLWIFDSSSECFVSHNSNVFQTPRDTDSIRQKKRDASSTPNQSFYYRPTTAKTQEMIQTNKAIPIGRYGVDVEVKAGKMVIFGGYSYLGLMNDTWELPVAQPIANEDEQFAEEFSQVPMNEEDINFELVFTGFRGFIKEKVKALAKSYKDKNTKVNSEVEVFRTKLVQLINKLDGAGDAISANVELSNSEIQIIYDEFNKFSEEGKKTVALSQDINGSLQGDFKGLKVIAKETQTKLKGFLEFIKIKFEKLQAKNETVTEELGLRLHKVVDWVNENSNSLANRIRSFGEKCDGYDKEISGATKKVEEINENQMVFLTDTVHKINDLRNNMKDFKSNIMADLVKFSEDNEGVIGNLDKQVENLKSHLGEKRANNNKVMDEIKDIVDNCITFIDVKFNDADSLNKDEKDNIVEKINEFEEAIKKALNDNKNRNKRFVSKSLKKAEDRSDGHLKALAGDKAKAEDVCADLELKQKKFTDSIMSDIDTIHTNEANTINAKCEGILSSIERLQLNATNIDQQVKDESVSKIQTNKSAIIQYCKDKINKVFEKCNVANNEMLKGEEDKLLSSISDVGEVIADRDEKYKLFQEEIEQVKQMIGELKDGHYDNFNEYSADIDGLKGKVDGINAALTALVEGDKGKELLHRDIEAKMAKKQEKHHDKIAKISKVVEELDLIANENIEVINHNKESLGGFVRGKRERLEELEDKINKEVKDGASKYDRLKDKIEEQSRKEKKDRDELVIKCNEIVDLIGTTNDKLVKANKNFKKTQNEIAETLNKISSEVLETASTCKSIDIQSERFDHAESSIQVVKDQNQTVKEKAALLDGRVKETSTQLKNESKQRNEEFVKKCGLEQAEIDELVKERVYDPIKRNEEQCEDRVYRAVENMDKCTEIINNRVGDIENERRTIRDKTEEVKRDVNFNCKRINDRRAQMGLSVDKINKELKEKRNVEHDILKEYQDKLTKLDRKNRLKCEDVIFAFNGMSKKVFESAEECHQQYFDTISVLDLDFIHVLPETIKSLETDAADLEAAVDEVRKQVRAHTTELTSVKASLRDVACISEKAYESSSKLIGRVKSDEAAQQTDKFGSN